MKTTLIAVTIAAFLVGMGAYGQEPANRIQTNLVGVTTSAAPPADFDYSNASDTDLEMYGLPPRPDEFREPAANAAWKRAMAVSKQRIVPQLEQTRIFHGPHQSVANSTETSYNWSAVVNFGGAQSYNSSTAFHFIEMDYVVPVATQAYGVCSGTDFSSTWVGIDGWESSDVLQAGTESDASCSGGSTTPFYSAWFEWFPGGEVRISNFAVAPGDNIFVEVWNTSPTQGYVYFLNYTTNQSIELGFRAPSGTTLVGNSAEWVVERPGVNGSLASLTNYVSDYLSNCSAYTWDNTGYTPGTSTALQLTMIDNSSEPISFPTVLGGSAIWFQDEGSAR